MKIVIDIDSETTTESELNAAISLLTVLKSKFVTDDDVVLPGSPGKELAEHEVDNIVARMYNHAVANLDVDDFFKTTELYRTALNSNWLELSPNTRKAIGRRFKKAVDEIYDRASDGVRVVQFKTRNIQNTSIYEVKLKESM